MEEVNGSIISSNIHALPSLADLYHQQWMTFSCGWVDGYCQNRNVTVTHSRLGILGGNTLVMESSEQITYQFSYLQHQKFWRLH